MKHILERRKRHNPESENTERNEERAVVESPPETSDEAEGVETNSEKIENLFHNMLFNKMPNNASYEAIEPSPLVRIVQINARCTPAP